jgi:splicing factor 3B subunit 3
MSVMGEFTAPGNQELVLLRSGGTLELHRIIQETIETSTEKAEGENDDEPVLETRTYIQLLSRIETRSILRACAVLRLTGAKRDVLTLSSDSGAVSILDFDPAAVPGAGYKILHCVVYGKVGCRRETPGQYLAVDPKGRAVMVAAIEKRKLVYVLNRDAAGQLVMASPLEAHRTRTITYAVCALDNGYDNPIFATLELQYPDSLDRDHEWADSYTTNVNTMGDVSNIPKEVAYYELDLGLNHVSRRWATSVHRTACCVAALPGGENGPGGLLIGSEDYIEYVHENLATKLSSRTSFSRIVAAIPRRKLHPSGKGILVTQLVVHRQKKSKFFVLAQSELGDVYKVQVSTDPTDKSLVTDLSVAVLDTIPTANALNISKFGLLFAAAEFGDHYLYQFERIHLPDAVTTQSSAVGTAYQEELARISSSESGKDKMTPNNFLNETRRAEALAGNPFVPSQLQNLRRVFAMENPAPTTGIMVGELAGNEVSPQIYTLTGRGPRSTVRILRHGASVTELAVSDLPGIPGGIFTIVDNKIVTSVVNDKWKKRHDQFIIVTFADATLVLSVGETIEEVGKEAGFVSNAPTLACSALGSDGAVCQVHPSGVRHIRKGQVSQWNCSGLKQIECASANEGQVLIAVAGGEVTYFELDPLTGNLKETATRVMGADVCCLDVGTIPRGRSRSLYAVVGCRDQTVRVVSLEPGSLLTQRSNTALKARPHSVSLQYATLPDSSNAADSHITHSNDDLTLLVGLDDGSSLRATIDHITGTIGSNPTRRFLGARPVTISRLSLDGRQAGLLLSSRPWISRRDAATGKHVTVPLSYAPLDHGCSFSSEAVGEGVVATAGKTLRILSIDAVKTDGGEDEAFNTNFSQLRYTPRQMSLMATAGTNVGSSLQRRIVLAVVESDYNDFGAEEKKAMGFLSAEGTTSNRMSQPDDDEMEMDEGSDSEDGGKGDDLEKSDKQRITNEGEVEDVEEEKTRETPIRGPVPPVPGHWASCVRLLDPANQCLTLDCVELGRKEAALCCSSVRFHSKGGEPLLAVGTVTGMTLNPLRSSTSHIILYRIVNDDRLQLLHRTLIDDGPVLALAHFQGRLLAGVGTKLRLYEMGKRQLLRKCEYRGLPTYVKALQTVGDRAFVGDLMRSVQVIRYDASINKLSMLANDPSPRPIVCLELLDWNTVAIGDKFGNVSILRLPRGAETTAFDSTSERALWESSREDQLPKLELICHYFVGEVVTCMTRSALVAGGAECIIYSTVTGRIGALVPFASRSDVDFYTQLEDAIRNSVPRPTGRDPQSYRSYYSPVMHVTDGELCDSFNLLSFSEQTRIAEKLDRTVGDILKRLEDVRNSLL